MKSKQEVAAILEAIGEVSERLSSYDSKYRRLSKVTRELASLSRKGYSEDTSLVILRAKELITEDEFDRLINM